MSEDLEFLDYCLSFYGEGGMHECGLTPEELTKAILIRKTFNFATEFEGDSIDRQMVRDIALVAKGQEPWGFMPDGTWNGAP
tara:strand:- start:261 stop:506 length:246 start_codon:yes stop_codon:yes gene_type:complete